MNLVTETLLFRKEQPYLLSYVRHSLVWHAAGLTCDELRSCVNHLPDPEISIDRIILSGGEVLVWPEFLFFALGHLHQRYARRAKLMVQTNGDLLDGEMLDRLLAAHVCRIDVSSMDQYHPKSTLLRRDDLLRLFESRGMVSATGIAKGTDGPGSADGPATFAFWGVLEGSWIEPLWPRGRAMQKDISKAGPEHRFCAGWSGAKGFLDYRQAGSEVNIQLADVYPCCVMTCRPVGNLLTEPLTHILDRCAAHPVFQALNAGEPERIGESLGLSAAFGEQRTQALGNQCLWCDEFFMKYAPDILADGARTERALVDLQLTYSRVRDGSHAETPHPVLQ